MRKGMPSPSRCCCPITSPRVLGRRRSARGWWAVATDGLGMMGRGFRPVYSPGIMDASLWSTFSALFGALVGGGISYLLNRQQFANQLRLSQEQHRTEFMAEE